ncbi:LLM class flavin-dependent oxidoreductase [Actinacidiphila glaucinigra]|uniref:LLM class flavin-dependent oxidoreductase n=1 Tax=Actinacidiphila glaucinigra TaxID=235986 RepID=UPI003671105E
MAGRRRAPPTSGPLPPLSVLDLAAGLGFRRVRVAERHGHRSVGSAAPPVLSARLAASTSRIRLGSGGVLLTNRASRAVAERFTTFAALDPGRVDLGIGRGPGTPFARAPRSWATPTAGACCREPARFPNRGFRRRASRAPNWQRG